MDALHEEYMLVTRIAKKIYYGKSDNLLHMFGKSTSNLISFNSRVGTIAHICVYLRNVAFLRLIIDKFDDPKRLMEWLSEKDENNCTVIDLVERFEFQEMYIYLNKILTRSEEKGAWQVLKEGVLDKYTNLMNGYKERYVFVTLDALFYGKKKDSEHMVEVKLEDVYFEHQPNMQKFKLITKMDEEFVFKDTNHVDVSDWINLFQNLMASRDKGFYFNNFIFKVIADIANATDKNLHSILRTANVFSFYIKECHNSQISIDKVKEGRRLSEDADGEDGVRRSERRVDDDATSDPERCAVDVADRRRSGDAEKEGVDDLELFSLESENEEKYEFFEADDSKRN